MNIDEILKGLDLPSDCLDTTEVETTKVETSNLQHHMSFQEICDQLGVSVDSENSETSEDPIEGPNSKNTTLVETSETSTKVENSETPEDKEELVEVPEELKKYIPKDSEYQDKIPKAEYDAFIAYANDEKENEEYEEKLFEFKSNREIISYYDRKSYEEIEESRGMNEEEWEKFKTDTKNLGDELGEDVSMIKLRTPRPQDVHFDYDPNEIIDPNDKLPYEFKMLEKNSRFMWDDYLFRIPFSKKMPKNVYDKLMAIEVVRKIRDDLKNEISGKTGLKYYYALVDSIVGDYDLNSILLKFKKHLHNVKDTLSFKDIKFENGKYITIPTTQDYPIFTITDTFDGNLPENTPQREVNEYNELKGLVENYYQKKQLGYMFPEGMLKIKDSRPITEEDDPWEVRRIQWGIEFNIEKWEFRCKVIKGKMMSLEQALAKGLPHPTDIIDEKLRLEQEAKNRAAEITEHPRNPNLIMVNGQPCNKELTSKTPLDSSRWPVVDEEAELEMFEDQFIEAFLDMEETIKEAKAEFKAKKEFYKNKGVAVKSVERAVKALRRELKRKPEEKVKEDAVYSRISQRMDIMNKITGLEALAI